MCKRLVASVLSGLMLFNMIGLQYAGSSAYAFDDEIVVIESEADNNEESAESEIDIQEENSTLDDSDELDISEDLTSENEQEEETKVEEPNYLSPEGATLKYEGTYKESSYKLYDNGYLLIEATGNFTSNENGLSSEDKAPWTITKYPPDEGGFANLVKYIKVVSSGATDFTGAFRNTTATEIDLSECDFSEATSLAFMFQRMFNLSNIIWPDNADYLKTSKLENVSGMFYGCQLLEEIDLSIFDTSNVTNMTSCFSQSFVKKVKFGDTRNVIDFSYLFEDDYILEAIEGLDTDSAVDLGYAFSRCLLLKSFDFSQYNMENVECMAYMFDNCQDLEEVIGLENVHLPNIKSTQSMFSACTKLKQVVLGELPFDGLRYFEGRYYSDVYDYNKYFKDVKTGCDKMFYGCSSLETIDMSGVGCIPWGCFYVLEGTSSLKKFITPVPSNIYSDIKFDHPMYLVSNDTYAEPEYSGIESVLDLEEYTQIPRKGDKSLTFIGIDTEEFNDEIDINYAGCAIAYTKLLDLDGNPVPEGTTVYYYRKSAIGGAAIPWPVNVQKGGYVFIYSDIYKYIEETPGNNKYSYKAIVYLADDESQSDPYNNKHPLKVVKINDIRVKDFSYFQNWKGMLELTSDTSVGEYNVDVGSAHWEASLASLTATGSLAAIIEAQHSVNNGTRELFLSQAYDVRAGLEGSVGPKFKMKGYVTEFSGALFDINAKANVGVKVKNGLTIKNYDPKNNSDQNKEIGKYLFACYAQSSGNVYLLMLFDILGIDLTNYNSAQLYLKGSTGADLVKAKFKQDMDVIGPADLPGEISGSLFEWGEKGFFSYDWIHKKDNGNRIYEKKITTTSENSTKAFNIKGTFAGIEYVDFNGALIDDKKVNSYFTVSGDEDSKKINKIEYAALKTEKEGRTIKISYSGDEAQKLVKDNPNLQTYYDYPFYYDNYMQNVLADKNATAVFSIVYEKKKSEKADASFGVAAGAGEKIKAEIEYSDEFKYKESYGEYIYNKDTDEFVFATQSSSQKDAVGREINAKINEAKDKYGLSDLFAEAFEAISADIANNVKDVVDKVIDGEIINDYAKIKHAVSEKLYKWNVHVVSILKGEGKAKALEEADEFTSYQVFTFEDESLVDTDKSGAEADGIACTVGDPYNIYVTDDDGNSIDDWEGNTLTLELSYEEDMLKAAGATLLDASALSIYMYSQDKLGYVCKGGVVDTINKTVTLDIDEPGQYILALDTKAPSVETFYVTDDSRTPTIVVSLDEMSDLKEFSLKLDDVELVNIANFSDYYVADKRAIEYEITEENKLSYGIHKATVYAVDAMGNEMKEPAELEIVIPLATTGISLNKEELTLNKGKSEKLTATIEPADATYKNVTWSSSDESVATVDKNGLVTAVGVGNAVIYAAAENSDFTASCKVTVNEAEDYGDVFPEDIPESGIPEGLWGVVIKNPDSADGEYYYTGAAIKPQIRVYDGKKLLKEKTDYTVKYSNNTKAFTFSEEDTGFFDAKGKTAAPCVTVTGKGNYSSGDKIYFKINPIEIGEGNLSVSVSSMAVAYNGKAQKPVPVIYVCDKTLKNGTDFKTEYYHKEGYTDFENPGKSQQTVTAAGDYIARITATGNYTGVREINLTVVEDVKKVKLVSKLSVSKVAPQKHNDGVEITPVVTVKDGKKILTAGEHYFVSYDNNKEVGTGHVIITGNPENGYSGSKSISFKITGISLSGAKVEGISKSVEYTGKEITFDKIAVTAKGQLSALKIYDPETGKGDIKIAYFNNVNSGTATVVFTGVNGCVGTLKKTFKILPFDMKANSGNKVSVNRTTEGSVPYAKDGAKPSLTVLYDGKQLTEGVDYTIAYANNKKAGMTGKASVKGKGNFKNILGTIVEYKIDTQDIANLSIAAADKEYQSKKNIYKTKVSVTDVDGKLLKPGTDYDKDPTYLYASDTAVKQIISKKESPVSRKAGAKVEPDDIIPAGTVIKVVVKGKGNYTGEITGTYRIMTGNISKAKLSVTSKEYTGNLITLKDDDITLVVSGKKVPAVDATTGERNWIIDEKSYSNNLNKGTAKVTVIGLGNYSGSKSGTFKITSRKFTWWKLFGKK